MGVRAGRGVGAAPTKRNRDAKRRGRQKHLCDLPYLAVAKIEAAVDAHLGTVRLRDSFQAAVRRQLDDALLLEQGHLSSLKKRMNARLDELETKEDGLLDLLDDPEWPRAKIKKKLADIERERAEIQAQLTDTASKLDEGQQFFSAALALLADPQAFSRRGGDAVKRAMTKVIFSKLHIDAEDVAGHDLADGIKGLVQAGTTGTGTVLTSANAESGSILIEDGAAFDLASDADLLGMALADHGSSRTAMVEVPGIEPGSSGALPRLLRAQFTTSLLGPTGHVNEAGVTGPAAVDVPSEPRGRVRTVSLLADAGTRDGGAPGPTGVTLAQAARATSA